MQKCKQFRFSKTLNAYINCTNISESPITTCGTDVFQRRMTSGSTSIFLHLITFQVIQHIWPRYTNITDNGWTNG